MEVLPGPSHGKDLTLFGCRAALSLHGTDVVQSFCTGLAVSVFAVGTTDAELRPSHSARYVAYTRGAVAIPACASLCSFLSSPIRSYVPCTSCVFARLRYSRSTWRSQRCASLLSSQALKAMQSRGVLLQLNIISPATAHEYQCLSCALDAC